MTNLGPGFGSGAFDSAFWTVFKFYCSLKMGGEQIKVMGVNIYFSPE